MDDIQIKRISMENYRCHTDKFELEFKSSEMSAIVGKNGSGKSSIFSALETVFYGDPGGGIKIGDCVNKKSGKNMELEADFSITSPGGDVDEYEVRKYYKHKKHKNALILFKNGVDISGVSITDTHRIIERMLLPRQVFKNTILFAQHVKDFFTALTDKDQKKIFNSILNLLVYEVYYKNADNRIKERKDSIAKLTQDINVLDHLIPEKKAQLANLIDMKKIYIKGILDKIRILKLDISTMRKRIKEVRVLVTKLKYDEELHSKAIAKNESLKILASSLMEKKKEELDAATRDHARDVDTSNTKCESRISKRQQQLYDESSARINKINADISNHYSELNKIKSQSNIDNIKTERDSEIETLETAKGTLKDQIMQLKHTGDNIKSEVKKIIADVGECKANIARIESADNPECVMCGQTIDGRSKDNALTVLIADKVRMEKEHATHVDEFKAISGNFNTLKESLQEVTKKISDQKSHYEALIKVVHDTLESESKDALKQIEQLQLKLDTEQDHVTEEIGKSTGFFKKDCREEIAITNKELERNKTSINFKYDTKEKELKSNLEKVATLMGQLEISKQHLEEHKNEINSLEDAIESKEDQIEAYEQDEYDTAAIDTIKEEIVEQEKNKKTGQTQLDDTNRKIEIDTFWKEAFSDKGIKAMLIDSAIPFLNTKVREELETIVPGKFIVSFDTLSTTKAGDMREKFSVNVLNTENGADSHKLLSGGEKRVIDVCIMMALRSLSESLCGKTINLILLDEVLDSLDVDNASTFCRVLKKLSGNKSINLITHEMKVDMECDNIYRL